MAVVQCTVDDITSHDIQDTCISSLKNSDFIDHIILAVPTLGNYKIFNELSKKWGVDVYFGSNYNVAERLYNATKKFEPAIVIRILLRRFYVDMELISLLIKKINEGFDYINLNNDIYPEISADICTFSALKNCVDLLKTFPDDYKSNSYRFNPWRFMEITSNFNVTTIVYHNKWSDEKLSSIQNRINNLIKYEDIIHFLCL